MSYLRKLRAALKYSSDASASLEGVSFNSPVRPKKSSSFANRSRNFGKSRNRQMTVSSGGCTQAGCEMIGMLLFCFPLDDLPLRLFRVTPPLAFAQMDLTLNADVA